MRKAENKAFLASHSVALSLLPFTLTITITNWIRCSTTCSVAHAQNSQLKAKCSRPIKEFFVTFGWFLESDVAAY